MKIRNTYLEKQIRTKYVPNGVFREANTYLVRTSVNTYQIRVAYFHFRCVFTFWNWQNTHCLFFFGLGMGLAGRSSGGFYCYVGVTWSKLSWIYFITSSKNYIWMIKACKYKTFCGAKVPPEAETKDAAAAGVQPPRLGGGFGGGSGSGNWGDMSRRQRHNLKFRAGKPRWDLFNGGKLGSRWPARATKEGESVSSIAREIKTKRARSGWDLP